MDIMRLDRSTGWRTEAFVILYIVVALGSGIAADMDLPELAKSLLGVLEKLAPAFAALFAGARARVALREAQ